MIKFTTLNNIITDLLSIIRGSEVVRTEPISETQIESWIHQYRALLIKRDLDKKRMINPDYVQTINSIAMNTSGSEYVTSTEIPNTIFRSNEDGFTWIGDTNGNEYQYGTEQRSKWQQYRQYTGNNPYVYLLNYNLYSNKGDNLRVKGIFENPMEVIRLNNPTADIDSVYPIPVDMVPTLKQMILKDELSIEAEAPSDNTNDSTHNIK